MLTSLLFIFKYIFFAKNSPTVGQSPALTPDAVHAVHPLTAAGAGSGLKHGAFKMPFYRVLV